MKELINFTFLISLINIFFYLIYLIKINFNG